LEGGDALIKGKNGGNTTNFDIGGGIELCLSSESDRNQLKTTHKHILINQLQKEKEENNPENVGGGGGGEKNGIRPGGELVKGRREKNKLFCTTLKQMEKR